MKQDKARQTQKQHNHQRHSVNVKQKKQIEQTKTHLTRQNRTHNRTRSKKSSNTPASVKRTTTLDVYPFVVQACSCYIRFALFSSSCYLFSQMHNSFCLRCFAFFPLCVLFFIAHFSSLGFILFFAAIRKLSMCVYIWIFTRTFVAWIQQSHVFFFVVVACHLVCF